MKINKRRRTNKEKFNIIQDYNDGMLLREIEVKHKISRATLYKYISEVEEKLLTFDEFLTK